MERLSHWIGGKSVTGESGRRGPVFNPATGEQSHEVDFASVDEVDAAIEVARDAFVGWRATSLSKRADILFRIRETIHEHRKDIGRLITEQHGKVLSDAMGEVARGQENIEFATGIPYLLKGGFTEQASTGVDVFSLRQPLGVVAGILLGRLQDERVPAGDRVREHPHGYHRREVERRDPGHHAERLPEREHVDAR